MYIVYVPWSFDFPLLKVWWYLHISHRRSQGISLVNQSEHKYQQFFFWEDFWKFRMKFSKIFTKDKMVISMLWLIDKCLEPSYAKCPFGLFSKNNFENIKLFLLVHIWVCFLFALLCFVIFLGYSIEKNIFMVIPLAKTWKKW